ncbi:dockerin type I domain-containing protein [Rhodopirellula baltica]|nr:dockerin type I domain-containing protein [Rhodopirellula baltica]
MLAATLNYPGQDVELQRTGELLRIVESSNNSSVLVELNISMIDDDRLEINAAAFRVDSDVNLAGNDLLVSAESIFVVNGGLLGADEVVLSASKQPDLVGDVLSDAVLRGLIATESQTIEVRNSRIDANQITLSANGITSTGWDELGAQADGIAGELISQLESIPQIGLSSVSPLSGQAKIHHASALIVLEDAVLNSTGIVDVTATAVADSSVNSIAVTGLNASGLPATVSVGFSHSTSSATIDVSGTTQVTAGGLVNIATDATSTAKNVARNEANSRVRSQDAPDVDTAINLSLAFTDETSTIDVSAGSSITSTGGVNINATGDVTNDVKATTAVFNDGTVGLSAAIGVDNAVVRSRVDGKIRSGSAGGDSEITFPGGNVFSGSELLILPNVPASEPIRVGERLTYRSSEPLPGLIDGEDYVVFAANVRSQTGDLLEQTVQVTRAKSIGLQPATETGLQHSLTRLGVLRFDSDNVSTAAGGEGQIQMTLPNGVTNLTYLGPDPGADDNLPPSINGLVQNQRYEAIQQGTIVKLRLPGQTEFASFTMPEGATAEHGFRFDEKVQAFDPATDVDASFNAITLPDGHGLQTGDFLLYATDPSNSSTREMFAFDGDGNELESLGDVTLPDAPIGGLDNHHGYYAVVDARYPNRLRLAGSLTDALASEIVDVTSRLNTEHSFTRNSSGGISVTASLTATNQAEAGVSLTQGEQPWSAVLGGVASGRLENIGSAGLGFFNSLRESIQGNGVSEAIEVTDVDSGSTMDGASTKQGGIDAAGSFVASVFDHDVHAIIGATADLNSQTSLRVDADIVQRTRLGAIGESTRNALNEGTEEDEDGGDGREFAVSGGYGLFNNDARAIVEDSFVDGNGERQHARLDAAGHVAVDAEIVVPFLGATNDGVNAAVTIDQFGLLSFESLLDGTHGLAGLVNVYARTLADGGDDSLSLALGLMINNTTNHVVARIGEGAMVQTSDSFSASGQDVRVTALLDTFNVGAGQMSALNLSLPGFAEAINRGRKREGGSVQDFLKDIADPLGVSGKNAAGGTMLLTLGDHATVAEIADSARVGGSSWGLGNTIDVSAVSDIYDLALVQTGTASSQFGFSAAIAASNIKTDTRASIGEADITSGIVTVSANDTLDRVNILGAFLKGKQIGVGTSIGVNVIDQNVAAFVGRENRDSAALFADTVRQPLILNIGANADGDILSWVISGGLQGIGQSTAKANAKQLGPISLNVPVAVNNVTSDSIAYADSISGDLLGMSVNAASDIEVESVVIGGSFSVQTGGGVNAGKLNLSGAGAVGVNTVVTNVVAVVSSSEADVDLLNLQANDTSSVHVDAGGFAIAASLAPGNRVAASFGVSVAINDVSGSVLAEASNSKLTSVSGDYRVLAASESETTALAIAGAASATPGNGSFGGAGAAAQNSVAKTINAIVSGGELNLNTQRLSVRTTDDSNVIADVGGVGIGVAAGPGASIAGAVGISLAFNEVANELNAELNSVTVTTNGPVLVEAITENASIDAYSIAASAGVAGSAGLAASLAGAGSGAANQVENRVEAKILRADIDSAFTGTVDNTDAITVWASDNTSISSEAIGASLAASLSGTTAASVAVGISISENVVGNQTFASVLDSTLVSASDISIRSHQSSTIEATAIAAALAVAGGNVGVGVSGAGASALNEINNQNVAVVAGSNLSAFGNVNVTATEVSDIDASISAATIAAAGGNIGAAAGFGFAIANNRIGDAATYQDDPLQPRGERSSRVIAVVNQSEIDASGSIDVTSTNNSTVDAIVEASSMAAAAGNIGATVAAAGATSTSTIEVEQTAAILDTVGSGIESDKAVRVRVQRDASATNSVGAATLAIAAGSYAGGVSVAVSDARTRQKNKLQSIVRGSVVNAGSSTRLEIYDTSDATATAQASAVSIAASPAGLAIAGGGATAISETSSIVDVELAESSITGGGLVFETFSNGSAQTRTEAITISAALIGIGASGSTASSIASPTVSATIADSDINVEAITLLIGEYTNAVADAAGLTISTGLAVGVSQASTQTNGRVTLLIDNPDDSIAADSFVAWSIAGGSEAGGSKRSQATAQGSAGGFLIGVDATVTSMQSNRFADLFVSDGSKINATGHFSLFAGTEPLQDASSLSVTNGLVAAGVTSSTVNTNLQSKVRIGENVALSAGTLVFGADARDEGFAHTVAGAVGGISGAVAVPTRKIQSDATIEVGDGSRLNVEGDLTIYATTDSEFDATLLAAAGGLLSGGGGALSSTVSVNSQVDIGDATLAAGNATIIASNEIHKHNDRPLGTVDASTGGLIAGVGSVSTTNLTLRGGVTIAGDLNVDNVGDDNLNIAASNEINAFEQTTLRSGGIAAGGNNTSTIRTLVDDAIVRFTGDASLQATGGVDIYAGGGGEIEIQSNSETFGAATVGAGVATIEISPTNAITFESGSEIIAQRDVNLSAGTDTRFNQDEYNIRSRVDSFAGSLIPIDIMDAVATLTQNNRVTIGSGAAVRSGGELRMHAEQFGDNNVIAQVKAVNWTTGVAGAIDGLLGEGGVEQFGGTADINTTGIVTVNGIAETGIARKRVLEVTEVIRDDPGVDADGNPNPETPELFTVVLDDRSTGDVTFEKRLLPVNSALDLALEQAEEQLYLYSDNSTLRNFYQGEVIRLKAELARQNLVETLTDSNGNSIQQRVVRNALTLAINPVFAQAGRIDVRAGAFQRGNGQLIAPGDASVEIINQTPASLIIEGIEVSQDAGGIFFNGNQVGGGEGGEAEKRIIVDNLFVPEANSVFTWPNITVAGPDPVTNLSGDILVRTRPSGAGSIIINAPVNGRSQQIIAGNNGTVVINMPELGSVYESGGAEHSVLQGFIRNDPVRGNGTFDGTVRIESNGSNPNYTAYLNQTPTTPSLTGASIFVSAQYINVNGLIQSGKPEYSLTITDATATEIAALRQNTRLKGLVDLTTVDSSDLLARYDADRDRIVIDEQRVSGGFVDLTGHITNTRNGEIRVLSDYAKIHIDNQTDIDLEVNRLDVSRRGEGTVIIKDLSGATAADPKVTLYQREGDVIVADINGHQSTLPNGSSVLYQPQNGHRYGWTIAEELLERTTRFTVTRAWLGLDFVVPDEDDVLYTNIEKIGLPKITAAGPFFYTSPNNNSRYDYSSRDFSISTRNYTCCGRSETNWIGTTTYYNRFITVSGTRTLHTHTIEADRPIDIRFEGQTKGEILIESEGDVYIAGALINLSGTTTIRSDASVYQEGIDGIVGGVDIRIDNGGGVGLSDAPLQTNLNEVVPFDLRSDRVAQVDGVEQVPTVTRIYEGTRVLFVGGPPERGEVGAVYQFLSDVDDFDLSTVDYTDTVNWQLVELFPSLGILTTDGNVFLHEIIGDLPIERILANRDGTDIADGDVTLIADGSIVQGRDSRDVYHRGWVDGNSINLTSLRGSVGSLNADSGGENRPLPVDAGFFNEIKNPEHRVTATAAGDVYLEHFTSAIVDSITAGGDVQIDFNGSGTLIDGNLNDIRDDRAIEDVIVSVWDDLQLTEGRGSTAKRNERIDALTSSQTQSYNAYWDFRETQNDSSVYDPDHRVTLSDPEREFYDNDADTIATIENSRTTQYHELHATWGPLGDSRDDDYIHTPTEVELAEIDSTMKVWTEDELRNLRSVEFLNVTDTEFVIEEPNIVGRTITLNANEGIGRYDNGATVDLREVNGAPPFITLEQQALITAAEPGDIVYLQRAPDEVIASISDHLNPNNTLTYVPGPGEAATWADLGYEVGDHIFLETNTRDTTDEGFFFPIASLDGVAMTLDLSGYEYDSLQTDAARPIRIAPVFEGADTSEAPFLRVLRREDIDVIALEQVIALPGRHLYLGSEVDLPIGLVLANNDVQIKSGGSILNANSDAQGSNIIDAGAGNRIVLESAEGSVGTLAKPLVLSMNEERSFTARAEEEVAILERGSGDEFRIGQIFSETSTIELETFKAIVGATGNATENLRAATIELRAHSIGNASNPLEINLIGDGKLTATTFADTHIVEVAGNLGIRQVLSRFGDVFLTADVSIIDAVDVADPYDPNSLDATDAIASLPAADVIGRNVTLTANLGFIGSSGNELDVDSDYTPVADQVGSLTTSSDQNTFINEVAGDLALASVTTDERIAFIAAIGGSIVQSIPDLPSILSGKVWLFARDDIGYVDDPILASVANVEGIATTGSVYLVTSGDLTIGGVVGPPNEGEGEDTGGSMPTRDEGSSGMQAGQLISIESTGVLTVTENVESGGPTSLQGAKGLNLPQGVVVESLGQLEFTSQRPALFGNLSATEVIVRGTVGDDIVIVKPESSSGLVRIAAREGNDQIEVSQWPIKIDAGEGDNTIIGTSLIHEVVAAPVQGGATVRQSVSVKENFSETPLSQFSTEFGQAPIVRISDERFELIDGILRLKVNAHLQHPQDNELEVTVTFTDAIDASRSATHLVTMFTEANQNIWTNAVFTEDVNRSGEASALDALVIINQLNRQEDSSLPLFRRFDSDDPFYDVTGDGKITALDALRVINYLNRQTPVSGEPEAVSRAFFTRTEPEFMADFASSAFWEEDELDAEIDLIAGDLTRPGLF